MKNEEFNAACGRSGRTAVIDSTAAVGLPGTFTIKAEPRIAHTPRLKAASGVFLAPSDRMRSAMPSMILSATARVASGVTSRAAMPVPPVVTIRLVVSLNWMSDASICARSSGSTFAAMMRRPACSSAATTAGPDLSGRSPAAERSLMVSTAAVNCIGGRLTGGDKKTNEPPINADKR